MHKCFHLLHMLAALAATTKGKIFWTKSILTPETILVGYSYSLLQLMLTTGSHGVNHHELLTPSGTNKFTVLMDKIDFAGPFLKHCHQHYKDLTGVNKIVNFASGLAVHNGKGIVLLRGEIISSLCQSNCQHKDLFCCFFVVFVFYEYSYIRQGLDVKVL